MLFVDNRSGSKELVKPLVEMGLPVESTVLDAADLYFEGRGVRGAPLSIGIEFKQLGELVQALRSERLQGYQMLKMRATYAHSYLFIEGELLFDKQGKLQRRSKFTKSVVPLEGQMTVGELYKRIQVLHLCGGLNPWWTQTRKDTLQSIAALYHTWTDTNLDQHKSHLAIYQAPTLVPISPFRKAIKAWPHVGFKLSKAAEDKFKNKETGLGSVARASSASAEEWADLFAINDKGQHKRIGLKVAEQIVAFCRGLTP